MPYKSELLKSLINESNVQSVVPIFINEMKLVANSQDENDIKYKDALLALLNTAIVNYERVQKTVLLFLQDFICSQKIEERY